MAGVDKANKERKRVVIFTQGAEPVLVVSLDGVTEVPVDRLPKENIVDTNAAGDAFVGGEKGGKGEEGFVYRLAHTLK